MAAPPIPTTTPMMVFLVLGLIDLLLLLFVPSAARTAVDVPVETETEVDDPVAVVRLPDTVNTVVKTTTELALEVNWDSDVMEEVVLLVFEAGADVLGVLEGVEEEEELELGGLELVGGGVEEGVLLGGVLLGVEVVELLDGVGVDDGVDDGVEEGEDVELTEELIDCDCEAFGRASLAELAETA